MRWFAEIRGSALKVIVHVGANCLADSRTLAAQARELGAVAVSVQAPHYFKPGSVSTLVASMAQTASATPELPSYYYEIPTMTGLTLSPSEFLGRAAECILNLAGIKFSSSNLMEYQLCCASHEWRFDIPFGFDEMLLGALALGAKGAVGSSFNFAAPIYLRMIGAFQRGDLTAARGEQMKSVRVIQILASRGYMGTAKAVMAMLGVEVGPPRLPSEALDVAQTRALRAELEQLGFFEWVRP